jgi:hypothetical protein
MANIDLTLGGSTGVSETAARKQIVFSNTIDFSGTHLVSGVSTSNNLLSTDIGRLLNIPAKFWMHTFGIRLDTVEGGTATAVFGDGADPNGWLATAVDLDGTADDFFQSGKILAAATPDTFLDLYHPGKYYTAADTIDIDPANDLATAVITVFAAGFILE